MVPFRGPKNTHKVPNEDQIKILIDPTVLAQVDAVCPSYLSRTAFINQAVDLHLKGIDTMCYPKPQATAEALEGSRPRLKAPKDKNSSQEQDSSLRVAEAITNKERARDLYKTKQLNPDLIPGDLLDVQQLLPEWWAVKKGVRSEGVFNRVCKALRGMTPEDRRTCLERATSGAWANIYEPKDAPAAKGGYRDPYDSTQWDLSHLDNIV
jgi:hypothetical protein